MAGLLPPSMRASAWWYAQHRGLPVSLGYLKSLGLTAARMARWEGLEEWRVPERHPDGVTYLVCMWPEHIWSSAATGLIRDPGMYEGWRDEIPRGSSPGWANPYD